MRAIRFEQHGSPEVLTLGEAPIPEPGPGQARVKIAAVGINFIDIYQRLGWYKIPLPWTPGSEAAGVVDAVGPGVTDLAVGDRVAGASFSAAYAEYAVANTWQLARVPDGVDLRVAAAVMLQGMTAHYLTHSTYPLKAGETALIYAASGGVGGLLTQIARMRGARTLCAVGSAGKVAEARELGADEVFVYREVDIAQEVRRLTGGKGVQVVYDSVGKDTFLKSLDCLAPLGLMVSFGQSSGLVEPFSINILTGKGSLFVTRPTLAHYAMTTEKLRAMAKELFDLVAAGVIKIEIGQTYKLKDIAQAHRDLEARKTTGSTVLIV